MDTNKKFKHILIEEKLHTQLKTYCSGQRMTIQEWVDALIREELNKRLDFI